MPKIQRVKIHMNLPIDPIPSPARRQRDPDIPSFCPIERTGGAVDLSLEGNVDVKNTETSFDITVYAGVSNYAYRHRPLV